MRASAELHPLETTLLTISAVLLCFMPWALGTMHVWSQFVTLALSALAFVISLINRNYRGELAPNGAFKLIMWPKLIRFPIFWLGLLLLGYIAIQALNPSHSYILEDKYWWLLPIEHISWLPSGIDAPYEQMNTWRVLVIYSSVWMLSCALWTGFTRRAAVQMLFTVVIANGALLAIIGILQKVTLTDKILWFIPGKYGYHFATIIYKNHAAAYFNLLLMLCTGLIYWHFSRAERRMDRASPAPVFVFFGILFGLSVILTSSRAGTILLMGFTLIAFVGFIIRCTVSRSETRSPWVLTVLCAAFALFIGLGAYFLNAQETFGRVTKLVQDGKTDNSVASRTFVRSATWDMAKDNLITGWGAGGFRHYFPVYQRNYPEIWNVPWAPQKKFRWEYAHNDYVQLLAELGLVGAGIVLAMLACGLRHLLRNRVYTRPHLMFVVLALVITAAHAWMDFQFHNPAILMLWCATAVLLARWTEQENRRS